jgi:hypothetical protein
MAKAILRRPLATALVAALGCAASVTWAAERGNDGPIDMSAMVERLPYVHERLSRAAPSPRNPKHVATTHFVDTCADDGSPNSLRSLIELSLDVHSGDTIDLTQLPMMCSRITLSDTFPDPAITVGLDTLYLQGPGADQLTIDANGNSSVFRHYGNGKLQIEGVSITNGYQKTGGPPQPLPNGGCIFSTGSVILASSVVSNCTAASTSNSVPARGGAIAVDGELRMYFSSIEKSRASSAFVSSFGGGASVLGDFASYYSTVSHNSVRAESPKHGYGGGVYAAGSAKILGTTISENEADVIGGIEFWGNGASIGNSTITLNVATSHGGAWTAEPLSVTNSTISFNRSMGDTSCAGLTSVFGGSLMIRSNIIADNMSLAGPSDVCIDGPVQIDADSRDNLIISSNIPSPPGTVTDCPKLEPLADNGGLTRTHALNHTSPAIDHGDNVASLDSDQRQLARVIGIDADIGAVEHAASDQDERIFLGGFDAKCEW